MTASAEEHSAPENKPGVAAAGARTGAIVVRRNIAATVDELFNAWLDAESLAAWMHPGTSRRSSVKVDARVGGAYEVVMHYDAGPNRHYGEYRVIDRNRKLVFTWHSPATHHGETLVTVEFIAHASSTEIVLTHERLPDHEAGLKHINGWTLAIDLLQASLQH